jgi:hypothetical protein
LCEGVFSYFVLWTGFHQVPPLPGRSLVWPSLPEANQPPGNLAEKRDGAKRATSGGAACWGGPLRCTASGADEQLVAARQRAKKRRSPGEEKGKLGPGKKVGT